MKRPVLGLATAVVLLAALIPAQPAVAADVEGAFLNPSVDGTDGPGTILSDEADGTDSLFHFVVRASAVAGVSFVRIQVQPAGVSTFITIGNATQVGSTDTYELFWDQTGAGIPEGDNKIGAVRAVVGDVNGVTATVPDDNGITTTFNDGAPAAEIKTPADGGALGFSNRTATISGTASGEVDQIDAFYTISPAGIVQDWKSCGDPAMFPPNPVGTVSWDVDCTIASGTSPDQVTAVAVIPTTDLPPNEPRTPGSGDAHRITGFAVSPNSVTITPTSSTQTIDHCQLFTLTVVDSSGKSVSGKNVDVHVIGTKSDVYFASVTGKTDPFTSPNFPASHSSFETADTCNKPNVGSGGGKPPAGPGQAGQEGVDGSNTKHIEGTTGSSGFTFAVAAHTLASPGTQIQGWYDVTDNDAIDNAGNPKCPAAGPAAVEPCATASVSWDQAVATSVTVSPSQGQAELGKDRKTTASVLDQHGNPMASAPVAFEVTAGPNASEDLDGNSGTPAGYFGFCLTAADGTCPKTYTDKAMQNGDDTITGFIDNNGNLAPDSDEPRSNAQQTWGTGTPPPPPCTPDPCATSLTIHPNTTQTIRKGHAITFHGSLLSDQQVCASNQTVMLLVGSRVIAQLQTGTADQRPSGRYGATYSFTRHPKRKHTYHTEFRGTDKCTASRAPASGGVTVRIRRG